MQPSMLADVLCAGLPALLGAAGSALPDARPLGLGIVRADESSRALFVYVDAFGSTGYLPRAAELPAAFQPHVSKRMILTPEEFANPNGLVESRLFHAGVLQ